MAVISTVPVPGIHVLVMVAVLTVKLPTRSVPPAVILISLLFPGVAPEFPKVRLEATRVELLIKFNVPDLNVLPYPPTVTEFPTVKVKAPPNVTVPELFNDAPGIPPIWRFEQVLFPLIVTSKPPLTITSSLESGTPSPSVPETITQIALFVQLPLL